MSSPVSDFFLLDAYALGGIFSQELNKLRQEGMTTEFAHLTQGDICSDLLSNFPFVSYTALAISEISQSVARNLVLYLWASGKRDCGNMRQSDVPPQTTSKDPEI